MSKVEDTKHGTWFGWLRYGAAVVVGSVAVAVILLRFTPTDSPVQSNDNGSKVEGAQSQTTIINNPSPLDKLSCANGQVIKWDQTSKQWKCAADETAQVTNTNTNTNTNTTVTKEITNNVTNATTTTINNDTTEIIHEDVTTGDLTSTTDGLTIIGGGDSVVGSGTSIDILTASDLNSGLLSATDWIAFNAKESQLTFGTGLTRTGNTITNDFNGTVTSVGLSLPGIFNVSGSPVTASGSLSATLSTQSANNIFAGPVSGGAAVPGFRTLVVGDIPDLSSVYSALGSSLYSAVASSGSASNINQGSVLGILAGSGITTTSDGSGNITIASTDAGGSVTSVGLSMPGIFNVLSSPVTTAGTISTSLVNQSANQIFAGPVAGGATTPSFRSLVINDIPDLSALYIDQGGSLFTASATAGSDNIIAHGGSLNFTGGTGINTTSDGAGNITIDNTGVTSVALNLPAIFNVSGTPVTSTGTLSGSLATQNANRIFAGPTSGGATAPTFRGLTINDIPDLSALYLALGQSTFGVAASSGTDSNINQGGTLTLTAGAGITTTSDGAGNITIGSTDAGGTVTSVGLSLPSIFSTSGSPVTTSGTLSGTLTNQSANQVFAGPAAGGATTPGFRGLVANDIPSLSSLYLALGSNTFSVAASTGSNSSINQGATLTLTAGSGITTTSDGAGNITIGSTDAGGTVTSVGLSLPSIFSVSGSPVSTNGTLTGSLASQAANKFFAGATTGGSSTPAFRSIVAGDLPDLSASYLALGSNTFTAAASSGSNSTINQGSTLTIAAGTGVSATNDGAGTITVANTGVTSVALSLPSIFSVSGTPVTTTGTLSGTLATETANQIFAGPSSGGAATPTFRSLAVTDIPSLSGLYLPLGGSVFSAAAGSGSNSTVSQGGSLTFTGGTGITTSSNGSGAITINNTGVTSVALSLPSIFSVSGSPVTTTGTLSSTLATQTANQVFAGPTSGGATTPGFRALVATDIPSLSSTYLALGSAAFTAAATSGSNSSINQGGTLTIAAGTGITSTNNASGTITIANTGVTSVTLSLPGIFSVSGSPVTTTGTLTGSLATQTANQVFAGPTSGGATTPSFRSLVATDIPDLSATYFKQSGNSFSGAAVLGTNDSNSLSFETNGSPRILIESGGNIAIGSGSASGKLDVTGTVFLRGLTAASVTQGALCLNNATKEVTINSGGSTCLLSSAKYKYDIQDGDAGLNVIMGLRPVDYKYNGTTEPRLGLIAEEVIKVEPRLVEYVDGEPNGVRYEELTSVLTKAVQQQQGEIEALKLDSGVTTADVVNALEAGNTVTINLSKLSINGSLKIAGELVLGQDSVGQVVVTKGSKLTSVTFATPRAANTIVTLTPLSLVQGSYRIKSESVSGFTVELERAQNSDISFNWIAVGSE